MNPFVLVEQACEEALAAGIAVTNDRAIFDWSGVERGDPPKACSALGAVLLHFGMRRPAVGHHAALKSLLQVDGHWLYRFCIGWSNNLGLLILDHDFRVIGKDDVSHRALALAKRYVRRTG